MTKPTPLLPRAGKSRTECRGQEQVLTVCLALPKNAGTLGAWHLHCEVAPAVAEALRVPEVWLGGTTWPAGMW